MNVRLPDVALTERSATHLPLDGVGMEGIDLPIRLDESGVNVHPVHARCDVWVDLPDPQAKGIHMSRLYRLLDEFAQRQTLSPVSLTQLLSRLVASHSDCQSTQARLSLRFELLRRQSALITEGLSGWKAYPVQLDGVWEAGRLRLASTVSITYSSTCPCSAALSRQLVHDAFLGHFEGASQVSAAEAADWVHRNATWATPHSQRSVADVRVRIPETQQGLGLQTLIDTAEAALGTPVQTAVKRADEQAFARLNGQNLMYVEDAARRIQAALRGLYGESSVSVRHFESLHPHDAVAHVSNLRDPGFSKY